MFLGIDIGNTTTMLGVYREDSVIPSKISRYRTDKKCSVQSLEKNIRIAVGYSADAGQNMITDIAFSSVVPEIDHTYHEMAKDYFNVIPLRIDHNLNFPVGIGYKDKKQLGIDRIVNTVAAFYEYGRGCIIVDIGTAATFDVLDHDSCFQGGLIAPGIGTTIRALADAASNLPEIVFEKPDVLVARDTVNAIKSGFFYGWVSMIEGIVHKIENEYSKEFKIIITGGFAEKIFSGFKRKIILDPLLTMKGIRYIYNNR